MKEGLSKENKINPETSSIREETVNLVQIVGDKFADKNTGEIFYKISKGPESQRYISLLCKGVINTADVIKYSNGYYSHEQDMDNLVGVESSEDFKNEIKAEIFIFKNVFGDEDKYFDSGNLEKDSEANKKYYYDFEKSRYNYAGNSAYGYWEEIFNKAINFKLNELKKNEPDDYKSIISKINEKASKFYLETFNENNFNWYKAVVNKSGYDPLLRDSFIKGNSENKEAGIKNAFDDLKNRFKILFNLTKNDI